jgi:hypothetical protein
MEYNASESKTKRRFSVIAGKTNKTELNGRIPLANKGIFYFPIWSLRRICSIPARATANVADEVSKL